jgi:hypothetical protein
MVGFTKNVMGFIKPPGFLHSGIETLDTPGNLTNFFGYREGRVRGNLFIRRHRK